MFDNLFVVSLCRAAEPKAECDVSSYVHVHEAWLLQHFTWQCRCKRVKRSFVLICFMTLLCAFDIAHRNKAAE
jgi:hypothetical protein